MNKHDPSYLPACGAVPITIIDRDAHSRLASAAGTMPISELEKIMERGTADEKELSGLTNFFKQVVSARPGKTMSRPETSFRTRSHSV